MQICGDPFQVQIRGKGSLRAPLQKARAAAAEGLQVVRMALSPLFRGLAAETHLKARLRVYSYQLFRLPVQDTPFIIGRTVWKHPIVRPEPGSPVSSPDPDRGEIEGVHAALDEVAVQLQPLLHAQVVVNLAVCSGGNGPPVRTDDWPAVPHLDATGRHRSRRPATHRCPPT